MNAHAWGTDGSTFKSRCQPVPAVTRVVTSDGRFQRQRPPQAKQHGRESYEPRASQRAATPNTVSVPVLISNHSATGPRDTQTKHTHSVRRTRNRLNDYTH